MEEKPKNGWEGINLIIVAIATFLFMSFFVQLINISDLNIENKMLRNSYKAGWNHGLDSYLTNPNNFDLESEYKKDSLNFEKIIAE